MENDWTPRGYPSVVPTLRAEQAERLLIFMQNVFDAEIVHRSADDDGKLQHAEVRIGHGMIEVSDANASWSANESSLHVFVPDVDDCYARAILAGAVPLYDPADMPYGERSGGVKDPFGNSWFISTFNRGAGRGYYD